MQNLKSVNTFTADHKYFFLKRNNLTNKQTIETISETEKISAIFFWGFEIYIKFWTFSKKRRHS